jgi:hypothetical protein
MTTSYPRHIASDTLYNTLSKNIDSFVEIYIGKYGRPKFTKTDLHFELPPLNDNTVITFLDKFLTVMTNDIIKSISKDDVDLLSIRDDIVANVNQAKYLFSMH